MNLWGTGHSPIDSSSMPFYYGLPFTLGGAFGPVIGGGSTTLLASSSGLGLGLGGC